jgi:hypothetical protein
LKNRFKQKSVALPKILRHPSRANAQSPQVAAYSERNRADYSGPNDILVDTDREHASTVIGYKGVVVKRTRGEG